MASLMRSRCCVGQQSASRSDYGRIRADDGLVHSVFVDHPLQLGLGELIWVDL